ncbi:hypothetical protein EIP91_007441 [Steccherinum ochraceum]|uniref:Uncharacterized protein n=1 Tax=Steccherinum ochraceum TaxID=92696 RepID=A0A4R0RLT0_9APHY|nr:hypothetical protein EIP91_007441 [Steccherinum ochraceum]
MGFLKRFFSMGSRKSKKGRRQHNHNAEPMPVDAQGRLRAVEPWQNEATRLLRSSSAHFTVVSEVDYSTLPPLPHPVNNVLSTPVATPARSTSSTVKRSGTYTVTVHGRTTHSRTEFPNANPPLDDTKDNAPHTDFHYYDESPTKPKSHPNPKSVPFTPRDQSRLLRLRRDPSVASLLNIYDDQGRVQSSAFANTPPNSAPVYEVEGREQKKRTGSTLRQLMGERDNGLHADCTAMEGDISWAERELARIDRTSMSLASESSLPLETPKDTHFPDDHFEPHVVTNTTFASDDSSTNWPVISSLEVELSGSTSVDSEHHTILDRVPPSEQDMDSKTPQRASEVFGFLTERRKSILERNRAIAEARDLPPLPALSVPGLPLPASRALSTSTSAMSTPPLTMTSTANSLNSSPTTSSDTSSAQIHHATVAKLTPMSRSTDNLNILYTPSPITVNVLPSASPAPSNAAQPSKIPRGPRPAPAAGSKHTPSASQSSLYRQNTTSVASVTTPVESMFAPPPSSLPTRIPKSTSKSHDPYTPVHKRPHRRTGSRSSSTAMVFSDEDEENTFAPPTKGRSRRTPSGTVDKENSPSAAQQYNDPRSKAYPKTPAVARSHSRALFDLRNPTLVNDVPPSPAKSIDLSPVGQDIMADVRKRRQQVRAASGGSGRGVRR